MKKLVQQSDQRRNALGVIQKSAYFYRSILDNVHDLIAIHKLADLSYEYVNPATLEVLGYTQDELFAKSAFELVHPEDMGRVVARMKENLPTGQSRDEFRYRKQDGSYVWLEVSGAIVPDEGAGTSLLIISRDITERKLAQAGLPGQPEIQVPQKTELDRLERALKVTRAVSMAAVQADNEDDLLHDVCRQIVDAGGYSLAWVGYVQADPQQKVKPVAHAGKNSAYLAKLNISLIDPKRGQGPVGTAIRIGQPTVTTNLKNDDSFKPWAKDALRRGFKSVMSIPLLADNKAFGVLSMYSNEPDTFDDGERNLLQDIANILAQAVITMRARTNI